MRRSSLVCLILVAASWSPRLASAAPAGYGTAMKTAMNRAVRSLAQRTANHFFQSRLGSLTQRRLLSTLHRNDTRRSLAQMVAREQARQRSSNSSGTLLARSQRLTNKHLTANTGGFGTYVAPPPTLVSRPSQMRRTATLRLSRKKRRAPVLGARKTPLRKAVRRRVIRKGLRKRGRFGGRFGRHR